MMLKKLGRRAYVRYLRARWKMEPDGASLLGGVFYQDYKGNLHKLLKVYGIHKRGFSWDDWHVCGMTRENQHEFLKTSQYYAMHPLNNGYSHWIDDKLTLKYLCAGTHLDMYMPRYYFQIGGNGNVLCLPDLPETYGSDADSIIRLLENVGELALKRRAGSLGEGFYKASFQDGVYRLNDKIFAQGQMRKELAGLRDYLVTEYLHPHAEMVPFCADTVNCLRYLVGRGRDGVMRLIKSYIRFGTEESGFVENYAAGGVLCFVNERGMFREGNRLNLKTRENIVIQNHPDTGAALCGTVPLWEKIQEAAKELGVYFPQMNYMGIDFVITDKSEVKILEINSLTSLDALQLEGTVLRGSSGEFFKARLRGHFDMEGI